MGRGTRPLLLLCCLHTGLWLCLGTGSSITGSWCCNELLLYLLLLLSLLSLLCLLLLIWGPLFVHMDYLDGRKHRAICFVRARHPRLFVTITQQVTSRSLLYRPPLLHCWLEAYKPQSSQLPITDSSLQVETMALQLPFNTLTYIKGLQAGLAVWIEGHAGWMVQPLNPQEIYCSLAA
jgi:hypothetical protein